MCPLIYRHVIMIYGFGTRYESSQVIFGLGQEAESMRYIVKYDKSASE